MFCRNCGAELPEGTKFCTKCGAAIQEPPAPPAGPPESTPGASSVLPHAPVNQSTPSGTSGRRIPWSYVIGVIVVLGLIALSIGTDIISPQELLVLLALGGLIWIAIRSYVLAIVLPRKNRAGIPCGLTAAQIASFLARSPWCEGQNVSTEAELIPNTQINAQIVFEGIRAKAYLYVEDGKLHAYSYNLVPVANFNRAYWAHQEVQNLLRYIAALEQGDTALAEEIRSKNRKALARRIGVNTFTLILYCILVVVWVVILVLKDQGIIKPIDITSPSKTEDTSDIQSDTKDKAQEPEDLPSGEPEDETPIAAEPAADAPYLGDYEMISEYENMGATLSLYYADDKKIYVDGIASYEMHSGEAYGPVQIVDERHLYFEEDGNRLDLIYDAASETLTVEETGSFGGMGVTFAGAYVRSDSVPDSSATGPDAAVYDGPSDADVANALAEIIPSTVAIPGQWSANEYGTVSVTPQSAVPGAFLIGGTVDIMMAQVGDGSWFVEATDIQCTVTYNYADEYYVDANNQQGFFIDSTVNIGGGYAWIEVTPLDFTQGSDPTGDTYICYLDPCVDENGAAYILCDAGDELAIYLDENMEPTAFSYEF